MKKIFVLIAICFSMQVNAVIHTVGQLKCNCSTHDMTFGGNALYGSSNSGSYDVGGQIYTLGGLKAICQISCEELVKPNAGPRKVELKR